MGLRHVVVGVAVAAGAIATGCRHPDAAGSSAVKDVVLVDSQYDNLPKYLFFRDGNNLGRGLCNSDTYTRAACSTNAQTVAVGKVYLEVLTDLTSWVSRMVSNSDDWLQVRGNFQRLGQLDGQLTSCFSAPNAKAISTLLATNNTRMQQYQALLAQSKTIGTQAQAGDPDAIKQIVGIISQLMTLKGDWLIDSILLDTMINQYVTQGGALGDPQTCNQLLPERSGLVAALTPPGGFPTAERPIMTHEWTLRTQSAIKSVGWIIQQIEKADSGFNIVVLRQGIAEDWQSGVPLWFIRAFDDIYLGTNAYTASLAAGQNAIQITVPAAKQGKTLDILECDFETQYADPEGAQCSVQVTSPTGEIFTEVLPLHVYINCVTQGANRLGSNLCGSSVVGTWTMSIPRCVLPSGGELIPLTLTDGTCLLAPL